MLVNRVQNARFRGMWVHLMCSALVAAGLLSAVLVLQNGSRDQHNHADLRPVDPETSCGPASLAIVAEYLGRPVTLSDFHEETRAGAIGVSSLADLVRALRSRGFSATAVRYNPSTPPTHQLPMVLFVDGHHFLAALPGPLGQVVIVDPPAEPKRQAWSEIGERWNGESVVVGLKSDEVEKAISH